MTQDTPVAAAIRIQASFAPKISLAFHQNAVPLLRDLAIVNDGDAALDAVEMTLASAPGFLATRTWRIESIGQGAHYPIADLDAALDGALLSRLTEAESAQATLTLRAAGGEIACLAQPIQLLPRNQWGGIGHMPEMVAAFVQPNDPAVDRILKQAADVLRQNDRSPALDGTQGGPKRAWELASAVWAAIGALGLDYALPPASFEHTGQKVRSPSQILDGGLATCLDTTLLFAACFEQCGLHPLVVCTRGHAFAGLWLKPEDFSSTVVDDITALRKRVQLNELVLFETTFATHRPCLGFGRAIERGAQQISEAEEDKFELAVDGIQHHVLVVGIFRQRLENSFENAARAPPAQPLVRVLPIAKALRQIPPRNACAIAAENGLDKKTVVGCGSANMPLPPREKIFNPLPLIVS